MIAVETVINCEFITKSELASAVRQKLPVCRTGWTVIRPRACVELQHIWQQNSKTAPSVSFLKMLNLIMSYAKYRAGAKVTTGATSYGSTVDLSVITHSGWWGTLDRASSQITHPISGERGREEWVYRSRGGEQRNALASTGCRLKERRQSETQQCIPLSSFWASYVVC